MRIKSSRGVSSWNWTSNISSARKKSAGTCGTSSLGGELMRAHKGLASSLDELVGQACLMRARLKY